ncbi:hypothetical protein GGX14DRAFT_445532, partial [Mycena pura]
MRKQKITDEDSDIEDLMEDVGLTPKVLATLKAHPEATKIVAEVVNRLGIKDSALKRARLELPSYLNITWSQVASHFRLSHTFTRLDFDPIPGVTLCYLPPSFHHELYMRSWSAMNVYAEPAERMLEAPRVRLLDIYLVPLFALFAGRIEDCPEHVMPETEFSSGGSVEHKIFIVHNILFLVIELKARFDNMERNIAHLFAELYSASKMNGDAGFESLTVYGLLTDLGNFHFYSFNPISKTFYRDGRMPVSGAREEFLYRMMAGSRTKGRSLEAWRKAHQHALAAQDKLKQYSGSLTALEESAAEGLQFLEKSRPGNHGAEGGREMACRPT